LLLFRIEVCLEVNAEKTEIYLYVPRKEYKRNQPIKMANERFLNAVYFRYRHPPL